MSKQKTANSPSISSILRIAGDIDAFAALTDGGKGVTRLAYSRLERAAHEHFANEMTALGLDVTTDAAGNTIAELRPTEQGDLPAIGTGSHLDSVPEGGRFDGIAGVVAAMEVARQVVRDAIPRQRPWRFVVFAAEEGARFGQACNGSRMIAGSTTSRETYELVDDSGTSMAEAMRLVGLRPDDIESARWEAKDWFAFLELHIEQGAVLESRGISIGAVDAISGSTRFSVTVLGQASHTGGTPMHLRRDALVTAAACVTACDALARDPQHHGTRITVGRLTVHPGSITTIPGKVEFTVDIRDVDSQRQRRTAEALGEVFGRIAEEGSTSLVVAVMGDTSPVVLPEWVTRHVIAAANELGLGFLVLPSGASHDSQQVNRIAPTGMIFVPSRHGLSHVPEEFTTSEQIACGTDVLLRAMMRLDGAR